VKLLRVIQEKTIRRVGGTSDRRIDVRIVAATNRNRQREVAEGRFREDLFYRLNVIEIPLPPLRERPDDIPLLVAHFIDKYAAEIGNHVTEIDDAAMERITVYPFPGNVRELENVIERAVALSRGPVIRVDSLPPSLLNPALPGTQPRISPEGVDLDAMLADFERGLLLEALDGPAGGIKKRAAQLLGISFRSLRYRLEKLGIENPSSGES
jgi:two-component system response regulator PilR (NtrC family)